MATAAQRVIWMSCQVNDLIWPEIVRRQCTDHIGEAELQGKSLYGKGRNRHKENPVKEGLDPVLLNAAIGYILQQVHDDNCAAQKQPVLHAKQGD
ncbi:uncharacterized protein LOC125946034 isoform X2 [Dermacentor silvarum]|nr:uncharacterized protein LOC125946034 isoform X2 [Dermacentor silvarum]